MTRKYNAYTWREIREVVIERDDEECQICGLSRAGHRRKYTCDLNVHHITPSREFDDIQEADTEDNLITLCAPCHGLAEGRTRENLNRLIERNGKLLSETEKTDSTDETGFAFQDDDRVTSEGSMMDFVPPTKWSFQKSNAKANPD
jgi:5-methylcytosine-specific restriction endonuclease McrA